MSLLEPPQLPHQYRKGKRKRLSQGDADDSVAASRGPRRSHLPADSINPLSHRPGIVLQFSTAGLTGEDENPSDMIPDFPHRGLGCVASAGRDVEPDSDVEQDADQQDDDAATARRKKKERREEYDRDQRFNVLLQSTHQFLDQGAIDKAARAYGLLLQLRPQGVHVDVRRNDLWAVGAEILMRHGEKPAVEDADADADATASSRHRWGRAANMNRVKAYFETLIQQHPYDYRQPRRVAAPDFWLALLSCEIYNTHTEHVLGLERVARDWEDEADAVLAEEGLDADWHEAREAYISRRTDELRIQAVRTMKDVASKMDELMQERPYSRDLQLLRLRAMTSLYLADIIMPITESSPHVLERARQASDSELATAKDALRGILDLGGQLDQAALAIVNPSSNNDDIEDGAMPLYSSLPIRGV